MSKNANNKNTRNRSNSNRGKGSRTSKPNRNSNNNKGREQYDSEFKNVAGKFDSNKGGDNDYEWYSQFPEVIDSANKIPFTYANGMELGDLGVGSKYWLPSLPGIMTLQYYGHFGHNLSADAPINMAARNMYNIMRRNKSGTSYYEAPDLMVYLCAASELKALFAELRRVYGIMNISTPVNKYIARHIVNALGYDYEDLLKNFALFRSFYNLSVRKVQSFVVPGTLRLAVRREWMNENIFTDGDTLKAQMYVFKPKGYWVFSDTAQDTGSALWYYAPPATGANGKRNYADIMATVRTLIDPITGSTMFSKISADIDFVFSGKTVSIPLIAEDYQTNLTYSREVLSQIENATNIASIMYDGAVASDTMPPEISGTWLKQNLSNLTKGSYLQYVGAIKPKTATNLQSRYLTSKMLNIHDDPNPQMAAIASRLVTLTSKTTTPYFTGGTETLVGCTMYVRSESDPLSSYDLNVSMDSEMDILTICETIQAWTTFDWAPALSLNAVTQGLPNGRTYALADYSKVGLLDFNTLNNLSEACNLSLYTVKQEATQNSASAEL